MTSTQKNKYDELYKSMTDGPVHREIKRTIHNPIKADDAFHGFVLALAKSEL